MRFEIVGIQLQNLRGFDNSRLDLTEGSTVLVGPNNSGKTSILRILDWVFNRASFETLVGDQALSEEEAQLLLPARHTGRKARRLTLYVRIASPKSRERYKAGTRTGIAKLRVGGPTNGRLRLNLGEPREGEKTDRRLAGDLLNHLRARTEFVFVPAARDAGSDSFDRVLREAIFAQLGERAVHRKAGGAPLEYRKINKSLGSIEETANDLLNPLADRIEQSLPSGLAARVELLTAITPELLVEWIGSRTELRLTTGEHDANTVHAGEVGSGLQSLLELALRRAEDSAPEKKTIFAVEEPEAFLHPSAQRRVAHRIFRQGIDLSLISTHSEAIVSEAKFGDVVLVRDRKFFRPATVDATREAINEALLGDGGATAMFARSLLLVEGESDRQFFEQLRRRVVVKTGAGALDDAYVLSTGSNTSFGPWIRLLTAYGTRGDRPIRWLSLADSDAGTELLRGHTEAGATVPQSVRSLVAEMNRCMAVSSSDWVTAARNVNTEAQATDTWLHFAPIDLEWMATEGLSARDVKLLPERVRGSSETLAELHRHLGSKGELPVSNSCVKSPWIRGWLGANTELRSIPSDVGDVLVRWFAPVLGGTESRQLVNSL